MRERLDAAGPVLLQAKVKTLAEALTGEVESSCSAGYQQRSAER